MSHTLIYTLAYPGPLPPLHTSPLLFPTPALPPLNSCTLPSLLPPCVSLSSSFFAPPPPDLPPPSPSIGALFSLLIFLSFFLLPYRPPLPPYFSLFFFSSPVSALLPPSSDFFSQGNWLNLEKLKINLISWFVASSHKRFTL